MKLERMYTDGLGFDSISLVCTVDPNTHYLLSDLDDYLTNIDEYQTMDLVFNGAVVKNSAFMEWLTARLIAEHYYISVVVDLKELYELDGLVGVFAQKVVVEIKHLFPHWSDVIKSLDQGDILLVRFSALSALNTVKLALEKQEKFDKVNLFFDVNLLDPKEVLENGDNSRIWQYRGDI